MRYLLPKTTYVHKIKKLISVSPSRSRGFTILETLVAISILVLALTAPLAIVAQALQSSYYARDQVTAYFLAQEAVEFLRNKRDNAGLQSAATAEQWTDTFLAANDPSGLPSVDIVNTTTAANPKKAYLVRDAVDGYKLVQCNNNGLDCPEVTYSPSATGALYGDTSGNASIFTREITISEPITGQGADPANSEDLVSRPPGLRELVINVRVRWRMANGDLSDGVTIREHLTNWQLEKTPPTTP